MPEPFVPAPACLSCAIVHGRREPVGGPIQVTRFFHAHQDATYPVPGFVVVAARRHVRCLDELAEEEAVEYITLLRAIRRAQRQVLGVEQVYYFLNEDTPHHLHGWMVPRYPWMQAFGSSVESLRPALMHAQRTFATEQGEAAVVEAVARLRAALTWPDPSRSS